MSWRNLLQPLCHALQKTGSHPTVLHRSQVAAALATEALQDLSLFIDSGILPAGCADEKDGKSWHSGPLPGRFRDVITKRTVYANNAGLYLPGLAELCLSAIKIFEWPCAANVYASPSRLEVSVPCHTDRQDVLVFQATGQKRWQIFHPPDISDVDPLRRGKDGDVIEDLGNPLLDVVLEPGDILYVPLGFAHQTSTAGLLGPTMHITLNLDSLIWGLSYRLLWSASLRCARLRRGEIDEAEEATKTKGMSWQRYSSLQAALPLGLERPEDVDQLTSELLERAQIWHGKAVEVVLPEDVQEAFQMLQAHRQRLLSLHQLMYGEAMLGFGDDPQKREAAHWSALQAEMRTLRSNMGWE